MKIGLYFGSFNPIHAGHLIIANYVATNTKVQQVWLVVSPQNPLKPAGSLLNEYHRLHLAQLAIGDNTLIRPVDVEFKLPKPSFTIDTFTYLAERYPTHEFCLIIGSDSYQNLHRWKNYEVLIKNYHIMVYNRPGFAITTQVADNIVILNAPMLDISSTLIRQLIREKKSIQYLLPDVARQEIEVNNYYR